MRVNKRAACGGDGIRQTFGVAKRRRIRRVRVGERPVKRQAVFGSEQLIKFDRWNRRVADAGVRRDVVVQQRARNVGTRNEGLHRQRNFVQRSVDGVVGEGIVNQLATHGAGAGRVVNRIGQNRPSH